VVVALEIELRRRAGEQVEPSDYASRFPSLTHSGHSLKGRAGVVSSVAFSPDGQRLASANRAGSIHLW
jgi:WD40 repeat protein